MQGLPLTMGKNSLWGKTAFNVNLLDWTRSKKNTTFACMILAVNDTFFCLEHFKQFVIFITFTSELIEV